ncbi:hypothetical protein OAT16_02175 [Prolixibacteraceae bacterium]|nr:hypothetical protein [Prolixibacteraceae bacterium]
MRIKDEVLRHQLILARVIEMHHQSGHTTKSKARDKRTNRYKGNIKYSLNL